MLTVLILVGISLFNGKISIFGWKPKKVMLFKDLFPTLSDKTFETFSGSVLSDSGVVNNSNLRRRLLCDVEPYHGMVDYSADGNGLIRFFQKLSSVKSGGGKVRIAYFGDSMIEGDLLTADLRSMFQEKFGGRGVGFVPITSVVASFRSTIRHTFYDDWKEIDFNSKERKSHALPPSGHVFVVGSRDSLENQNQEPVEVATEQKKQEAPWVLYQSSSSYKSLSHFQDIRLFYGNATAAELKVDVSLDKNEPLTISLEGSSVMNVVTLNKGVPADKVRMSFMSNAPVDIYGCSFESDSGVFIDNYAFRGTSGAQLTSLPVSVTNEFDRIMQYDLVVLEYGLNVSDQNTTDVTWYVNNMIKSVNHIRACFPAADILLIGAPDKGYKNDEGEIVTQPSIPLLVEAQRTIAKNTGIVFWDLYSAMGGYNTMKSWAEATPPLAGKDYTHMSQGGARKVAQLLFDELMRKYGAYAD
ncbi:MAG: GDSL-type esterase/lipase family protein [Bacteroidota bacterium]